MFYALIYAGVCSAVIAVAVWNFLLGHRLGAALLAASALPMALIAGMRLNNCLRMRVMVRKQSDTRA